MDALSAAKARIDRALNEIEAKLEALKARADEVTIPDEDLFAPLPSNASDLARIADLEAAGQEASDALALAAEAVRAILEQQAEPAVSPPSDESEVESQ